MSRVSDWFGNTITQDVARPLPSTLPVSVFQSICAHQLCYKWWGEER